MKIVVGITGASGAIYGIKLLQRLRESGIKTHLILTEWAEKTIEIETGFRVEEVRSLAHCCYDNGNLGAPVASGSFRISGMVVVPCSMKTLSGIAYGYADSLLVRAADVMMKERQKLILVPRETPLNAIHLENMLKLARLGVVVMPPVPAFYSKPLSLDDLIDHFTARILDQLGIENSLIRRWEGLE